MIVCTKCGISKSLNMFSPQKTNPRKMYSWCDDCRKLVNSKPLERKSKMYSHEVKEMRDKAMQLRKFDDAQTKEIKFRRQQGEKVADLAVEYKCSQSTIRKTLNRL